MKTPLPPRSAALLFAAALVTGPAAAGPTLFTFTNPALPLTAASGDGTLDYFDRDGTGWGSIATQFGKASSFSLPPMADGDPNVMAFPACAPGEGYTFTHKSPPNGALAETPGLTGNYTMIFDVFYPEASDGEYRALWQTDPFNSFENDAEFFVANEESGGVGINSNYRGGITPGVWHRVAVAMRAAAGEGQARRYIDGRFVGAIGTTGSGLDDRFGLAAEVLLLTDDDNETRPGYLSSFYFVDRVMTHEELLALGGPSAAGANAPGAPAVGAEELMARRVKAIGHRGGSYGSAPDNTLAALNKAFAEGAAGVEVDTRLTADGVAVCFHDSTLDRTTNGTGPVNGITLEELQLLDAGSKYDPAFAGEKVPSLAEALTAAKGKGIVYLDIKTDDQAQALADAVAASGFPVADLWFWTPGKPDYATEIRSLISGAKILWGGPPVNWKTVPSYFSDLRALGVIGFSIGTGTGAPDLEFVAKAKAEGFLIEVYTINDQDTMRLAAANGADYIETDYPAVLNSLLPAALPNKASNPLPAPGSEVGGASTALRWLGAQNATAHRVHFGTVNPPPFVREQASDVHATGTFASGTTYYWRIDEVTPGGTVTGDVWTFTTEEESLGTVMEWGLNGSLTPAKGGGALAFADGANTQAQTSFETTDHGNVPHIAGVPADFLRLPAFSSEPDGLALTLTGIPANGGGAEVNRYSFVFDVLVPNLGSWTCFFSTIAANSGGVQDGDGEFFIQGNGSMGVGAVGYSPAGSFTAGEWHRVIFSADLGTGNVSFYVDGVAVRHRTGTSLLDSRFGLLPATATPPHVRLFNDNSGETSEMLVSAFAFVDTPLSPIQAAKLGGAKAAGIFVSAEAPPPPVITRTGNNVTLTWPAAPGRFLQRSTNLTVWSDIPSTAGLGTFTEAIQSGARVFYRAAE